MRIRMRLRRRRISTESKQIQGGDYWLILDHLLGNDDGSDWGYTWNSYATIPHDGTWNHFSVVWNNDVNNNLSLFISLCIYS